MNLEILEKIGLGERESKVYLALIKLGTTIPGDIQKESQIPSSKIGETLNKLHEKELVEVLTINNKKHYKAKDPNIILERYEKDKDEIEKTVKELKSLKKIKESADYAELYQGFAAIRSMFRSLLDDGKEEEEYFGFTDGKTADIKEIWDLYVFIGRLREEKGVKNMQLANDTLRNKYSKAYNKIIAEHKDTKKTKPHSYKEMVRYTALQLPGDCAIFRDNLILLNLNSEVPNAILINGKIIADNYKKFFRYLWKNAKKENRKT